MVDRGRTTEEPVIGESEAVGFLGVKAIITRSDGPDGAVVVFIDTEFEPDASDGGPGLRVLINDDDTYVGVEHIAPEEN